MFPMRDKSVSKRMETREGGKMEGRIKHRQRERKGPEMVCFLCALCLLLGGLLCLFSEKQAGFRSKPEYFCASLEHAGAYSYLDIQYLSYPIASYVSNEDHQICLAEDMEGYPYIVCLDETQLESYQELLDYTYGDSGEDPGLLRLYGYPQVIQEELKDYIVEYGNQFWDSSFLTRENVSEYFGSYFLDTTQTEAEQRNWVMTGCGVFLFLFSAVLLLLKLWGCQRALGAAGAFLGAAAGSVLWILSGRFGALSGAAGVVMIILARKGYRLLAKDFDRTAAVLCTALSFLQMIPANLAAYVLEIYRAFGYHGAGGVTLGHVIVHVGYYLSEYRQWGSFVLRLTVGYALCVGALMIASKKRPSEKDPKEAVDSSVEDPEQYEE